MKTELTINDIAPYLPYRLKITGDEFVSIEELDTLSQTSVNIKGRGNTYGMWADISDIKPLLIPLSELKSHAHLFDYGILPSILEDYINGKSAFALRDYPFCIIERLYEHHFDVMGLIDSGMALNKLNYSGKV